LRKKFISHVIFPTTVLKYNTIRFIDDTNAIEESSMRNKLDYRTISLIHLSEHIIKSPAIGLRKIARQLTYFYNK
jgi:hypothetical protein